MTNRLANESSPYLLQHAENPVDWYPWSQEALQRAQAEDKPILLSIGYAACHWCHVMAHESFEDAETAAFMNEHFINVKVDREERPDLDSIYMNAVVAMTGQGGWPMTVVLTPEGEPFFGGTYFPKSPRYGMPSFKQVLVSLARAWHERRYKLEEEAARVAQHLQRATAFQSQSGSLDDVVLDQAFNVLESSFNPGSGGFGKAPKFPQPMTLEFLIRRFLGDGNPKALHMAQHTLKMMARGGMYDQIGGGFARYSTDDDWLVPHFEKMLYDNALLCRVYLHTFQISGDLQYRRIVEETLDWALAEMRHEDGGFYSSLDADSEGLEGKFYVWSSAEIQEILGHDADIFMLYYGVTDQGNWEGHNILNVSCSLEDAAAQAEVEVDAARQKLAAARQKLYEVRSRRVPPGLDDKVLTAWNGLLMAALAEAGRDLKRSDYLDAAVANAEFLRNELRQDNGRLLRTWKAGLGARYNGYLEDYAFLAEGLLTLYECSFEPRWYQWAVELAEIMIDTYLDEDGVGFFDTSSDHETLIHRPKDLQDNAVPSGNALAAQVLLQLSLLSGEGRYWDLAAEAVSSLAKAMSQYPTGFAQWLCAADFALSDTREVAISGDPEAEETQALLDVVFGNYRPNLVVAAGSEDHSVPLLKDRPMIDGKAAAYVCQHFVCELPVTDPNALKDQLDQRRM